MSEPKISRPFSPAAGRGFLLSAGCSSRFFSISGPGFSFSVPVIYLLSKIVIRTPSGPSKLIFFNPV